MFQEETVITDVDQRRLRSALDRVERQGGFDPQRVAALRQRVRGSRVVRPNEVPSNVVTMNSLVALRNLDSGDRFTCRLAYPHEARRSRHSVSVAQPLGVAMLGKRVGQVVRWARGDTDRRLRIQQVLYQPEAAGELNL